VTHDEQSFSEGDGDNASGDARGVDGELGRMDELICAGPEEGLLPSEMRRTIHEVTEAKTTEPMTGA
jgi:hypothetical protein